MISKTPLVCLQVPKFSISTEGSAAHTSSDTSLSKGTKAGFALKMAYVKACSQVWLLTYSFFPRKQMMVYSLENCISSTELFCFLSFKLVMLLLQAFSTLVLAVPESGKCCVVLVDSVEDVELCIQVRLQLCMAILVFQISTFCKNYKGVEVWILILI